MKTTIKFIGGLLAILAFFWVLGSVGACECENISLGQCMIQSLVGIVGVWGGLKMASIEEENNVSNK